MRECLDVIIPGRNEMFFSRTVENILENIEGDTRVIAMCDGNWPDPPVKDHPRVTLVYYPLAIGQRAATNQGARLSEAKYIMKADAHCSFDRGFDVKLMEYAKDHYDHTVVPTMFNLHAFNWRCKKCGNETYQGPTPTSCENCDNKTDFERKIYWRAKTNPRSDHMVFDKELHFQYWREFKHRPEAKGDVVPTMSLIGAAWFMWRDRYWELGGMDEEHGSWGQMGTEIACKSFLSGGELVCLKKTWFAHMFRTQGGDFSFPYPNPGVRQARRHSQELWRQGKWSKAKYPLSWLLDRFWPVPGWEQADLDALKAEERKRGIKV